MKMKTLAAALAGSAAFGLAANAHAYLSYFGEDLNSSATTPLSSIPNSSGAETSFKSNLVGVGTETFEGQTTGAGSPLALTFPGAGTATLSGSGSVVSVTPGTTNGAGRYSVPSATSSKYWSVTTGVGVDFTVTFTTDIAAFGFYGIDISDYGGQLTLSFFNGANLVNSLAVPNTVGSGGSTDGSVLFYGLIAQTSAEEFDRVVFSTSGSEAFAFDDFTIGTRQQVQIPEPASLALMGLGLAGLAASRRRKQSA